MSSRRGAGDDAVDRARVWAAVDPDPATRTEVLELVARAERGEAGARVELVDRFDARLQFGTAGLRGALGGGPNRMNRLIVRQAAWGLGQYLLETVPDARERGVVIGYDARRNSDVFAQDTACALAALGIAARLLPPQRPTPVLAWSIGELGVAAGVMVTASHNPANDNGYKVYLGDGAQIVPPHDVLISEWIDRAPLAVPVTSPDHQLVVTLDDSIVERYLDFVPSVRLRPEVPGVPVVATAMHGVGGATLAAAFERSGFDRPVVVAEQQEPDPDFPTAAFPNPEEPGAMDLLIARADEVGAAVALANDPDADRLGVAIPLSGGGWRRLGGDEVGWLLADHILRYTEGDERLVVTTLVSSQMLARMAVDHGVHFGETFTGFKWIGRMILDHPDWRFVFGYEQALGYLVAPRPLDKDGISAAVLMAEVAAGAVADGSTLEDRLAAIRERYGNLVTAERSIRMDPTEAAAKVAALVAAPPASVGPYTVTSVEDFPAAGLLRLWCGNARLQVRPSGTEPKVKLYVEVEGTDPGPYVEALASMLGVGSLPDELPGWYGAPN